MVLAHQSVTSEVAPSRWLYMLHGIYGAGRNWGMVARPLVERRPDWGVMLVDLRQHGASQGFEPPHTLEAAARDVAELVGSAAPASAVLGHSFGGKVALEYAAMEPPGLAQVWVIDSTPHASAPAGSAWTMLEAVRSLPGVFETRAEAVGLLVSRGVAQPVAQWMSTNLEHGNGRYHWRIDLDDMEALLRDFFAADLWHVVETPPGKVAVHVVRATESSVLSPDALERIASIGGRTRLHEVEGGHWLNADNPDALVALLSDTLPGDGG